MARKAGRERALHGDMSGELLDVVLENVSFGYEVNRRVLRNGSIKAPKGSGGGIIGRTGTGKSTFVNLLTRFYDPSSGAILLDGVDLREYRLADLRAQFALVLDPALG